jgi:hypothetical protein
MFWFPRQWRRRCEPHHPRGRRPRTVRPSVTELETRVVPAVLAPNFIDHGGPVLESVQIEVVFYGDSWQGSQLQGTRDKIAQFLGDLSDSSFLDVLAQYHGPDGQAIQHGQVTDSAIVADPIGSNVTPSDIETMLLQRIGDGTLQPSGPNRLYFVFTPPGVSVNDTPGTEVDFLGYHADLVDRQGRDNAYAVIPFPGPPNPQFGGLDQFQSLTNTSSHELAEAVTDPYSDAHGNPSGFDDFTFDPSSKYQGEIGDICNGSVVYLHNYAIQKLYSAQAGTCVAPAGSTDAPSNGVLQVVAQAVPDFVVNQANHAVLAVVTDTDPNVTAANLTATVDWGDGQVDTNVPIQGPNDNGQWTVEATHTYAGAGQYSFVVTVNDSLNGSESTDMGTATVTAGGALDVTAESITAPAGQAFTAEVAFGTDPGGVSGDVFAGIDWGDGTQADGVQVTGPDAQGHYTVEGTHVYDSPGTYDVTVAVEDFDTGAIVYDVGTATVTAAGELSVTVQDVTATAGVPTSASQPLALVSDPGATAGDLTATIDWGDGRTDDNVPLQGPDAAGNFVVAATHTYASNGQFDIHVTVGDLFTGAQADGFGTATVAPAAGGHLTLTPEDVTPTVGQAFTGVVAVAREPGANAADLTATIDWGDGHVDTNVRVSTNAGGDFVIRGTHTYATADAFLVTITVQDRSTGATATDTAVANVQAAGSGVLAGGRNIDTTIGDTYSGPVCVLDLGDTSVSAGSLHATINWGDGTQQTNVKLTPTGVRGRYVVDGSHTFTKTGTQHVSVAVSDSHGVVASTTSVVEVQQAMPQPQPQPQPRPLPLPPVQLPLPQPQQPQQPQPTGKHHHKVKHHHTVVPHHPKKKHHG